MQLLITLKRPKDLSHHLPEGINSKKMTWNRLWNFSESLLKTISNGKAPEADLALLFDRLTFDMQCLFKTFEVTTGQGIDARNLVTYWKQHEGRDALQCVSTVMLLFFQTATSCRQYWGGF